tara:strand:+ start:113 stop:496 length:384 start_codon:yes stop_codon:yes gene_type:complete
MKKIFGLTFFLILISNYSHLSCQVVMKMDPKIKRLTYNRASQNKVKIGYRIHLTFDENVNFIQDCRVQVISRFPGIDTYIIFKTPAFYLEAGNFLTEHDAELVRKKLRGQFPMSSVVKQKIEMPRID